MSFFYKTIINNFLYSRYSPELFTVLKNNYSFRNFLTDLLSGLTVAIVALPLAMAIAIASDLPPERGLFTAIVAGFLISFLGGSRYQIGGPTAAFIVTVATVAMKHGYEGLVIATILAGIILIILGFLRAGELIKFIPYPVITGFTSGIAFLIFFTQIKDFLGLNIVGHMPIDFLDKVIFYSKYFYTFNQWAIFIGLISLIIMLVVPKIMPKIPAPMIAVIVGGVIATYFNIPIETIESKFGTIPNSLPPFSLPEITFFKIRELLPDAITIAILAGIESLLSVVVADGMTGGRHKANAELIAQGSANIFSAFFGGIPATGAIARTATNIRSGAKSPISGIMHSIWLLIFMMLLSPIIIKIPLATLSAILMVVAWNMSEIKHVKKIMKAPRSDRIVLFVTMILTITVDLNFAVQTGISLALLLFVRSTIVATDIRGYDPMSILPEGFDDPDAISKKIVHDHVEVYEITGPLFFGVVDKLQDTLQLLEPKPKVFILRMRYVTLIDSAGIHALEEVHKRCQNENIKLILSGVSQPLFKTLNKSGVIDLIGRNYVFDHIDKAIERANFELNKE